MPILLREPDLSPSDLLDRPDVGEEIARSWYALYTLSRREKELVRRLLPMEIAFYCPTIEQRYRSPSGRLRTSFVPLFTNYVFLYGSDDDRYRALTTNCVARDILVPDAVRLTDDLRRIRGLIETGAAMTRESRIDAGQPVRIRTGAFRGYEGYVIRREGERRLLVSVDFLQQGASVLLDDCEVEPA
jgi:transcription antitermination factor NusG